MGADPQRHGPVKVRPYGSGFLIFSDYGRAPIRLAAIMEMPVIYIFTHDSIGVGEDGPTHQPIEQLASLRAIPGLIVASPGDANEVVEAWKLIMQLQHEPVVLILTRQALPTLDRTQVRPGRRAGARGLRPGRRRRTASPTCCCWPPAARCRCASRRYEQLDGRGDQGPRGEHAVVGAVRRPAAGVPRPRAAAGRDGAGLGRAGLDLRLGAYVGVTGAASACAPSAPRPR